MEFKTKYVMLAVSIFPQQTAALLELFYSTFIKMQLFEMVLISTKRITFSVDNASVTA